MWHCHPPLSNRKQLFHFVIIFHTLTVFTLFWSNKWSTSFKPLKNCPIKNFWVVVPIKNVDASMIKYTSMHFAVCLTVSQQGDLLHAAENRWDVFPRSSRCCDHPSNLDHQSPQTAGTIWPEKAGFILLYLLYLFLSNRHRKISLKALNVIYVYLPNKLLKYASPDKDIYVWT